MKPLLCADGEIRRVRRSRARRGQALVVAILGLTLLTAAAIALSATARLELRTARREVDRVQREAALRGLINRAVAQVEEAREKPEELLTLLRKSEQLQWQPMDAESDPEAEPLLVAVQVIDASSRLNINTAAGDQLRRLPGMEREVVQAIEDWKGEDEGEDDEEYVEAPRPYQPKDRPFDTLEELLMVRGVEPALLFGAPTVRETQELEAPPLSELLTVLSGENNTLADGTARADVNNAEERELRERARDAGARISDAVVRNLVQQREQGKSFRNMSEALQAAQAPPQEWGALMDAWTADGRTFLPGRVNVNTAPRMVLSNVPRLTGDLADQILSRRRELAEGLTWKEMLDLIAPAGARQEQEGPGQQPGQQQQRNNPVNDALGALADAVCFRSAVYIVRCLAREPGSNRTDAVTALVYLPPDAEEAAQVVQWRQPERYPGWTAWFRPPAENEQATNRAGRGTGSGR